MVARKILSRKIQKWTGQCFEKKTICQANGPHQQVHCQGSSTLTNECMRAFRNREFVFPHYQWDERYLLSALSA